jgi:hypothetical protein
VSRDGRIGIIVALVVGISFAAGWYGHSYYVAWRLATLFGPTSPPGAGLLADTVTPSGEVDPAEDIADPTMEYSPSERDCPNAEKVGQTSRKSGPSRTKYFDSKTGQLLAHWEYPDAPKGIVQELKVNPESADEGLPMAGMLGPGASDLPKNQGVSKIESKPDRYRFSFDPEENELEYVVTVYECDPSGGEARSQA